MPDLEGSLHSSSSSSTETGCFTKKAAELPAGEDDYLKSLSITMPSTKLPDSPSSTRAETSRTPTPTRPLSTLPPPVPASPKFYIPSVRHPRQTQTPTLPDSTPAPPKFEIPGIRPPPWSKTLPKDTNRHNNRKDAGHSVAIPMLPIPTVASRSEFPKPRAPRYARPVTLDRDTNSPYFRPKPTVTKTNATATSFTSGIEECCHKIEHQTYDVFSAASYCLPAPLLPRMQQKRLADVLTVAESKSVMKKACLSPKDLQKDIKSGSQDTKPLSLDVKPPLLFVKEKAGCFTEKETGVGDSDNFDSDTTEDEQESYDDRMEKAETNTDADEEWDVVVDELAESVVVEKPDMDGMEATGADWELLPIRQKNKENNTD